MKSTLALMFLLSLVSCGAKQVAHKKVNIHPQAARYVATFEQKGNIRIDDLEVTFQELPISQSSILGYCRLAPKTVRKWTITGWEEHTYNTPLVVLNTKYWDWSQFLTADKEELVYHELGHCVKKLNHVNSTQSIMYPYHLGAVYYENNYSMMMNSLFSPNQVVAAYSNMFFDPNEYASTFQPLNIHEDYSSRYPAFVEVEVPALDLANLKDCVDEKAHELIIENKPESEENTEVAE